MYTKSSIFHTATESATALTLQTGRDDGFRVTAHTSIDEVQATGFVSRGPRVGLTLKLADGTTASVILGRDACRAIEGAYGEARAEAIEGAFK